MNQSLRNTKEKLIREKHFVTFVRLNLKSSTTLRIHKKSKHEGIRYDCHLCDYKATQKGDLKRHIQRHMKCTKN